MRRIIVTGANKGIGLAIVERILAEHADTFVYLGARDAERGRAAAAELVRGDAARAGRLEVLPLDVAEVGSVANAARHVRSSLAGQKLYGIVNNAGVGDHTHDIATVVGTNTLGVRHVCEAFLPLLAPDGGRIVNVTSAAGPMFVAGCRPERQRLLLDPQLTWPRLQAFIDECLSTRGDASALAALGLDESVYGLSKACANAYTVLLAREQPGLRVNACTPGFILTDLSRGYAESLGKSPAEMGMKTPAEGARAPLHLLFGELEGNGRFYGSDAKRSPLNRYRSPGSPEYRGD